MIPLPSIFPHWSRCRRITARKSLCVTWPRISSGLPGIPENLDPQRADNPYVDYTVEKMYAFLSGHKLVREPGAMSEDSNLGMDLLGHAIELKAGSSYESLVVDRICQPLGMESTRIMLAPEQKARFATGHNRFGEPVRHWDVPTLAGAGAVTFHGRRHA